MSQEQNTVEFLMDKVKKLELDVQYEMHLREQTQNKYEELYNTVKRCSIELMSVIQN